MSNFKINLGSGLDINPSINDVRELGRALKSAISKNSSIEISLEDSANIARELAFPGGSTTDMLSLAYNTEKSEPTLDITPVEILNGAMTISNTTGLKSMCRALLNSIAQSTKTSGEALSAFLDGLIAGPLIKRTQEPVLNQFRSNIRDAHTQIIKESNRISEEIRTRYETAKRESASIEIHMPHAGDQRSIDTIIEILALAQAPTVMRDYTYMPSKGRSPEKLEFTLNTDELPYVCRFDGAEELSYASLNDGNLIDLHRDENTWYINTFTGSGSCRSLLEAMIPVNSESGKILQSIIDLVKEQAPQQA